MISRSCHCIIFPPSCKHGAFPGKRTKNCTAAVTVQDVLISAYIQMIQTSRKPVITAVRVKGTPNFMKVDDFTS